jgi:hypothetical protein
LQLDALGELLSGGGGVGVAEIGIFLAADGGEFDAGSIESDFHLAGQFEAADGVDGVAPEADFEAVFGIEGEGVVDEDAAAGAEWKAFDMAVLGEIGAVAEGVSGGGNFHVADGEAADLPSGGHVALHEHGRDGEGIGDVVEAVGGVVGG